MLGTRSKPTKLDLIKSFLAIALGNVIIPDICLAVDIPPYSTVCADKGSKYDAIKQDCVCPDGEVIKLYDSAICQRPDLITQISCTSGNGTWNSTDGSCSCPESGNIKYKTQKCGQIGFSLNDLGGYLSYKYTDLNSSLKIIRLNSSVMSTKINQKCYNLETTSSLIIDNTTPPITTEAYSKPDCSTESESSLLESGMIFCNKSTATQSDGLGEKKTCTYSSDAARPCNKPYENNPQNCLCGDNQTLVMLGMSCPIKCGNSNNSNDGTCTCPDGSSVSTNDVCPSFKPLTINKEDCIPLTSIGYTWNEENSKCEKGLKTPPVSNSVTTIENNTIICDTPLDSSAGSCKCKNGEIVLLNNKCNNKSSSINSSSCANIMGASWSENNQKCTCSKGFEIKNSGEQCPSRCSTPSKNDPSKCTCKDGTTVTLESMCPAITTCSEQLSFPLVNTIPTFQEDSKTNNINSKSSTFTDNSTESVAFLDEGAMTGAPFMVLAKGGKVICDTQNSKDSYNYKVSAEISSEENSVKILKPAFFLGSIGTSKCPLSYLFGTTKTQDQSDIEKNCGCGNVWAVKFTPEKRGIYSIKFKTEKGSESALAGQGTFDAAINVSEAELNDSDHKSDSFYRKGFLRTDKNGFLNFNSGKEYFIPVGIFGPNKDITSEVVFPYLLLMINGKACTLFDYIRMLKAQEYNIASFFPNDRRYSVLERLGIYNLIEYMQSQGVAAYIDITGKSQILTRELFSLLGHNNAIIWSRITDNSYNVQKQPFIGESNHATIKIDEKLNNGTNLIKLLKNGYSGVMAPSDDMTPWNNKAPNSGTEGLTDAIDIAKSTSYALQCIHASAPLIQTIKASACEKDIQSCVKFTNNTSKISVSISTETGEVTPLPGGSCEEMENDIQ